MLFRKLSTQEASKISFSAATNSDTSAVVTELKDAFSEYAKGDTLAIALGDTTVRAMKRRITAALKSFELRAKYADVADTADYAGSVVFELSALRARRAAKNA